MKVSYPKKSKIANDINWRQEKPNVYYAQHQQLPAFHRQIYTTS